MALQSLSKLNIDKALKFALVCIVIISLMMSWIYIPQAEAVLAPALVIGAGVGSEVIGSVIATLVMAVTGVCFDNGFFGDTDNLSTVAYEQGYQLLCEMMLTGGTPATWLESVVDAFALAGGFKAGDEIEVPAEVLEFTRNWVNENYDFGDVVSITHNGIVTDSGEIIQLADSVTSVGSVFSPVDCTNSDYSNSSVPIIKIGDIQIQSGKCLYKDSSGRWRARLVMLTNMRQGSFNDSLSGYSVTSPGEIQDTPDTWIINRFDSYTNAYCFLYLDAVNSRLCFCFCDFNGTITYSDFNYVNLDKIGNSFVVADSILTGTDSLSVPQTEDITITVPDVSMSDIGGYSVPAVQQLTGDMVIDKTTSEEVVPDFGGIDTEPSFTVPDTWAGIDAWFKAQGLKLTNIFTEVRDFAKAFPQTLNDALAGVLEGVLEAVNEPVRKIKDKFNEAKNKLLPFIKNGFGFPSIWHYVVAWVGTLGAWLTTMFTVWSGLPYAMVLPVYATAVVVIVIGIYRRFFM